MTDSGDHMNYDVAVSGMTGDGTVTASLVAGVAMMRLTMRTPPPRVRITTYNLYHPRGALYYPADCGLIVLAALNGRGYIDVTYSGHGERG